MASKSILVGFLLREEVVAGHILLKVEKHAHPVARLLFRFWDQDVHELLHSLHDVGNWIGCAWELVLIQPYQLNEQRFFGRQRTVRLRKALLAVGMAGSGRYEAVRYFSSLASKQTGSFRPASASPLGPSG